ncbi:unnamed protein product, partial [marine sediment metagenome]
MLFIRQGATHKVVLGPAVAVGDGFTPVTNLDVATSDEAEVILHDNGTVVDISGYTWAAIATADGYYHLTLQNAISGTVGHLTIVVNDDSLCLPLRADFTVLDTAPYDANFKDAATGPTTTKTGYTLTNFSDANAAKLEDILDGTGGTGIKLSTIEVTSTTTLTGNVTLSGTLGVGATTFASLVVSGTTTLTGAVSLSSTLGVTGATTFASLIVSGTTALTGAVTMPAGLTAAITGNITGNLSGTVGSV